MSEQGWLTIAGILAPILATLVAAVVVWLKADAAAKLSVANAKTLAGQNVEMTKHADELSQVKNIVADVKASQVKPPAQPPLK